MKIILLGFVLLTSSLSFAQSGGASSGGSAPWTFASQKAQLKQQSRWSLNEWLATRERMKWSDMWLALNSASPYEFFLLGAYNLVPKSQGGKVDVRYGLGAYVKIFGLEYEHDNVFAPEDHARFHLRLFGLHVQNTNLTFQAGMRFISAPSARQGYLGLGLSLYLHQYFGFNTLYRYYLAGSSVASGSRFEIGPFLDFGFFRVFGNYLKESTANGWVLGGQIFF